MRKIPAQFYIYAMSLLCYFCPWQLYLFDPATDALLTVIVVQRAFIAACKILVKELWIIGIILIEVFCMLFNMTFFLFPSIPSLLHEQIMLTAFIIELLIITISLQGVAVGRSNICRLPMSSSGLWGLHRNSLPTSRCDEVAQ